jgi:hypothetical protein
MFSRSLACDSCVESRIWRDHRWEQINAESLVHFDVPELYPNRQGLMSA